MALGSLIPAAGVSPLIILGSFVVALCLYFFIVAIYRLTFHPYAKYPGPFLAKLTSWYAYYHAYNGDTHLDMWRCHEIYGPVVRYGPDRLTFNSRAAMLDIYSTGKNVLKAQSYAKMTSVTGAHNIVTAVDKHVHGPKRRIMSQGFSEAAVRDFEPHMLNRINILVSKLGESLGNGEKTNVEPWSTVQNMADWSNYIMFDIMADLVFAQSFRMLEDEENRHLVEAIDEHDKLIGLRSAFAEVRQWKLEPLLTPGITKKSAGFIALSKKMAFERMQEKTLDRKDILSYVLAAKDPETGKSMPVHEVWSESMALILAGSKTSSIALAATFFYLTHNSRVYKTLQTVIRSTFAHASEIRQGPALSSCKYLQACIDEALRMSPPVGHAVWREAQAGGAMVDGELVPAGYDMGTAIYSLHHNPLYFEDPFEYRPERWLVGGDVSEEDVARARSAFGPFSLGSRGCVGKALAYRELYLTVAMVAWTYDFRTAEDENGKMRLGEGFEGAVWGRHRIGEYQTKQNFVAWMDGPLLQFKRRSDLVI